MEHIKRPLPTVEVERIIFDPDLNKNTSTFFKEPISLEKRINHKEEFELAYLRWRYLIKAENPSQELLRKYEKAAYKAARASFTSNFAVYKASGMELEDVCNIALVHLVSYLGNFSIQHNKEAAEKYLSEYEKLLEEKPDRKEIERVDLSNMICFISQRMRDLIRICKQKNRNVTGELSVNELFVLIGEEKDCSDPVLAASPFSHGFRKATLKEFKNVKKHLGSLISPGRFTIGVAVYRFVSFNTSPVWISDYENGEHLAIFNLQEEQEDLTERYSREKFLDSYSKAPKKKKIRMLRRAIKYLDEQKAHPKELALAKKMLRELESNK